MTHVFVAPHPDDVALSCGGLICSLRELGQNVTILTVFSGAGEPGPLTSYQREALGFGTKALWPNGLAFNRENLANDFAVDEEAAPWLADPAQLEETQAEADTAAKRFWQRASWYRRADIYAHSLAGQPVIDDLPSQGAVLSTDVVEAAAAGDLMARRRLEDERYAYFQEASVVFLDLPDAVFRGYEGDVELLAAPRRDDPVPHDIVRREIARLEPQAVYFPLGVGGHVDHQLVREVGLELLGERRGWVMPGPDYVGQLFFYEDFPYAYWSQFSRIEDLPEDALDALPPDISLSPEYSDISDVLERKINGIRLYESQLDRLFDVAKGNGRKGGGEKAMERAVRDHAARIGAAAGLSAAERYWRAIPV